MPHGALVLDANILIRAVLGSAVRQVLVSASNRTTFYTPEVAWRDAERHLGILAVKRRADPSVFAANLDAFSELVQIVAPEAYQEFEEQAQRILAKRDPSDWPILACALALECAVWTQDQDLFGCGVATVTTDLVMAYLHD